MCVCQQLLHLSQEGYVFASVFLSVSSTIRKTVDEFRGNSFEGWDVRLATADQILMVIGSRCGSRNYLIVIFYHRSIREMLTCTVVGSTALAEVCTL